MTQAETRGRGRPKLIDEEVLIARITGPGDYWLLSRALEENGEPPIESSSAARYLERYAAGDPTGGVSRRSAARYRQMFAQLPEIPLPTPKARRSARRNARGHARIALVGAGAGAGVLALAASNPQAVNLALSLFSLRPPIMPHTQESAPTHELAEAA